MAFRILMHALRMITSNFGDAVKVTLLLTVVGQVAVLYTAGRFLGAPLQTFDPTATPDLNMTFALPYILGVLAQFFLSAWVAVGWHRFILTQEYPAGFLPKLHVPFVMGYLGRLIIISLVMVALSLPLLVVVSLFAMAAQGIGTFLGILVMIVVLIWASLRLSLVLPAISVGKAMSIRESWNASNSLSIDIFGLAALLVIVGGITTLVPVEGTLGTVFSVLTGWVSVLVGASILTTLYGILIEGRDIK